MEHLKEIVLDYIKTDSANNHALMIDGEWGSGKTHYFKEVLKKEIEQVEEKKVLYISLNGLQSGSDIFNELIAEKSKFIEFFKNTTVGKITYGALESAFKIGINAFKVTTGSGEQVNPKASDLSNIMLQELISFSKEKHVICFDDLERISEKLNNADVLGFINRNFVEHEGIKVIIICDESRINASKNESYGTIKEKVVGRTLKFPSQVAFIFDDLISTYLEKDKPYHDFLISHKKYLLRKIILAKEENLRTIFFMLDNLWKFFRCLAEEEQGMDDPIKKMILANITFSFEEKEGELSSYENIEDLPPIFTERHLPNRTTIFGDVEDIIRNIIDPSSGEAIKIEKDEAKTKLVKKRKYLVSTYWENDQYEFFPSVFEYIKTGYLNNKKLTSEIRNLIPEELPDHEGTLNKISNPYELDDEDFNSLHSRLIDDIKEDKHNLQNLVEAAKILYDLEKAGIDASLSKEQLDRLFFSAIPKAKEKTQYEEIAMVRRLMSARTHGFDKAQEIIDEFKKALRLLSDEKKELEIDQNLQKLKAGKKPKIDYKDFQEIIAFHDSNEIIKAFREKFDRKPSEIGFINELFELTYLREYSGGNILVDQKEAENLKAIYEWSNELMNSIDEKKKPISFIWARSIALRVEKIVHNLQVK
ncbi:MAG TPA: P-loop NTPase fold protein [Saprospiraceae bacterium]|nr:P-loop NTPase fold protein [Saprospiraceae bacterium]